MNNIIKIVSLRNAKRNIKVLSITILILFLNIYAYTQNTVVVGAEQIKQYFPLLLNKKVALTANQTSLVNQQHLADLMLAEGIQLQVVFSPEHGFRGNADAGQQIKNGVDSKTGLPIISLYGRNKKPSVENLEGIDIVVFDIQDVGVRFYTYISSLHYIMEACAENNIPLLVLDRPNPNGFYVDGPILKAEASSFVGMHTIPLVHGMTIGEYAFMINEEYWLKDSVHCDLMVVPCKNYTHNTFYELPVKPSPNLPNIRSVYLYPSLGLFEGTIISIGRGTPFPFQIFGHPELTNSNFKFTPVSMYGAKYPKLKDKVCFGKDLRTLPIEEVRQNKFSLKYLIECYQNMPDKTAFFNNFFYRLAGSHTLQKQIIDGMSEEEIRDSWQVDIDNFKRIRKKYLLYPDFE